MARMVGNSAFSQGNIAQSILQIAQTLNNR